MGQPFRFTEDAQPARSPQRIAMFDRRTPMISLYWATVTAKRVRNYKGVPAAVWVADGQLFCAKRSANGVPGADHPSYVGTYSATADSRVPGLASDILEDVQFVLNEQKAKGAVASRAT